jgi:PhnB protein
MPVKSSKPVPDDMNTVTVHLLFNGDCRQAIKFYQKVFNASVTGEIMSGFDGNSVMHAQIKIGDTNLMVADGMPNSWAAGPKDRVTATMFLYVDDCDRVYNKVLEEGGSVIQEMMDAFWGDRMGSVKDPFGHVWGIATKKWDLTPDEMAKAQQEWMKSMSTGK